MPLSPGLLVEVWSSASIPAQKGVTVNFNRRLILCAIAPASLFLVALAFSLWGLMSTQNKFDHYISTEQATADSVNEMYAQGLQMGQALRNVVLDPSNKKAYENFETAEKKYAEAYAKAQVAAAGTELKAAISSLEALRSTQAAKQVQVLEAVKADQATAMEVLKKQETPAWRELRAQLLDLVAKSRDMAAVSHQETQASGQRAKTISMLVAAIAVAVSAAMLLVLKKTVANELGGDPADARRALQHIANGDLTYRVATSQHEGLLGELQKTQQRLQDLVSEVRDSTNSIHTASAEIAVGSQDLSMRTEQTASSLQQTASSIMQLTDAVKHSADAARQANQLAVSATEVAQRGGEVVSQVVSTMGDINASSQKISDIIGVIDGIAFQTNILALNAAVEAARAGEQGRGFAVVASEVRSLAQRSATAAKEIKTLIGASVDKVEGGARLVADAGQTMNEIVASVQRVTDIVAEISHSSQEQSEGIMQVNHAIAQLDQMTQQNAALVEQSAAAAESLKDQGTRLSGVVGTFRL
ncbi:MAG: methyl-accepting chemotaxis protein [Aquabacterium sp.]